MQTSKEGVHDHTEDMKVSQVQLAATLAKATPGNTSRAFEPFEWIGWYLINKVKSSFLEIQQALPIINWIPPQGTCIKLNMDNISHANSSRLGYDDILCNVISQWLTSYLGYCGCNTSLVAKLHTICNSLKLSWKFGFKHIICETNSKCATNLITKGACSIHHHAPLVHAI
ncbi:hypothetical protein JHK82_018711 [Glycine max]|nr:hypothetical protein JHK85_019153 [Glycine max]KAG5037895.1 hypothetical protein JHK86_018735 [Glycine max]KAG5143016.1 hypothetical protein JHK82_018711 [Glycine max]